MRKLFTNCAVRLVMATALSAVFLYVAFSSLEWQEFIAALQQFNPVWLAPVGLLALLSVGLHALRWQLILKPSQEVPVPFLFEAIVLGRFVNLILPIRLGTLVQAYLVTKKYQVSMFTVLGTFAVEQAVGSTVFGLVSIGVLLFVPVPDELANIRRLMLLGLGVAAAALALFLLMAFLIHRLRPQTGNALKMLVYKIPPRWRDALVGHLHNFRQGLRLGNNRRETAAIFLYSFGIRIVIIFITLCVARGFGITLPFLTFLFLDVLVMLAHGIAGHLLGIVGTFEATLTYSLTFYGVARETGLGIALLIDVVLITPIVVLGLVFLLKDRLTWTELTHLRRQSFPTFSESET